ncbi:nonsense-mediated mRNA decay factor SMG5-like [Convolutriloba macropyga]|uniref:nonsense-mediated mRNA decay factor SMG5-like n=1 Tax=Convolutriloba macropyga TaxID=536237 RepID=UPI003F5223C0
MSRSYDERCQLYFDAIRECKLLPTIINPEMNLKRQKLQSETIILLSNNVNDEDLQIRILALFWSKICYSTIANLRRCWKQLKRGSTGEVDCQNFMLALYSFFQTISTRLSKDRSSLIDWNSNWDDKTTQEHSKKNARVVEKVLICQGDICRYLLEIDNSATFESMAKRNYMQAQAVNSASTQPLCQLGTLMLTRNFRIDSVYWFFRALHVAQDCSKAKVNLDRILGKNARLYKESSAITSVTAMTPKDFLEILCKKFCSSLIYVLGSITFKNESDLSLTEMFRSFTNVLSDFSELCKFFLSAMHYTSYYLNDTIIFNSVVMCIIAVEFLQKVSSDKRKIVTAFVLSYFGLIVHLSVIRIDYYFNQICSKAGISREGISECEVGVQGSHSEYLTTAAPKKAPKRTRGRHRRRRRVRRMSTDLLSDEDEGGNALGMSLYSTNTEFKDNEDSMTSSNDDDEICSNSSIEILSDESCDKPVKSIDDDRNESSSLAGEQTEIKEECKKSPNESPTSSEVIPDNGVDGSKILSSLHNFEVAKSLPHLSNISVPVLSHYRTVLQQRNDLKTKFRSVFDNPELMASMNVMVKWLAENESVKNEMKYFSLTYYLTTLTNRINVLDLYSELTMKDFQRLYYKNATIEDFALRNVKFLAKRFQVLDFDNSCLENEEKRFCQLAVFHDFLQKLTYDGEFDVIKCENDSEFLCNMEVNADEFSLYVQNSGIELALTDHLSPDLKVDMSEKEKRKLRMMESMGKLRLQSEVERLKREVEQISANLPFVIPEVYCFTNRLDAIRRLAESKGVIIIVCKTVLNCLDSMKREQPSARDAIKFLENALSTSNTCVRAQKDYEYSLVDLSSVSFNWRRNRKLVSLCDMLSCANYFVQAPTASDDMGSPEMKQATLLFENPPDPANMGVILNSLGDDSPIGHDVLDRFCQSFFSAK